jgi:hypothetical protein
MPQNQTALFGRTDHAIEVARKLREKIGQKIVESALAKAERHAPSSENEIEPRQRR